MYANFFGLKQEPFSIAPDPRYLFMSERHREALAHLLYGTGGGGGFVLLTGEIGAGKTTVCRCFLEQIPRRCNVAYIFNPKLTVTELLKSVCDEFRIPYREWAPGQQPLTVKEYLDPINEFLLKTHAVGQNNILIIDEAQHLSADVLEQLRLLTNLETNERKLLQIILIGQPELRGMLARPELEQLAQRVIARFHLEALTEDETSLYIRHRLAVAGLTTARPFDRKARQRIHQLTRGVPRRINLLCDRALLGAYAAGKTVVDRAMVEQAAREVFAPMDPPPAPAPSSPRRRGKAAALAVGVVAGAGLAAAVAWGVAGRVRTGAPPTPDSAQLAPKPAAGASVLGATASSPAIPAAAASGPGLLSGPDAPALFKPLIRDENDAWRELAALWSLDIGADGNACSAAQQQQVQCFKGVSTLLLIRQLGRPGILTLYDDKGRSVYALLTGLDGQGAVLRMGGVSQTLSQVALARLWRGEFATLWRSPAVYRGVLSPGQSGAAVEWLADQLARAAGEPAAARKQAVFDTALKSRVIAFQVAQGLQPDGIAGPTTFMQLNRVLGVDEPRLQLVDPAHKN